MKHAAGRSLAAYTIAGLAYASALVLASTLFYAASPTAASAQPVTSDSRIKTFVYNPNEVFSITTHYGYQSNVEFALKESIETISVGDRVGWQVVPAGRRLFIRAMEENARTNMTVVTNLRAYQFELRSSSATAVFGSEALTYVVRFFYPGEALANASNPLPPATTLNSAPLAAPSLTSRDAASPFTPPAPVSAPMAPPAPTAQLTPPAPPPSLAPALVPSPAPAATSAAAPLAPLTLTPPPPAPPKQSAANAGITPLQPAAPKTALSPTAPAAEAKPPAATLNYRYTFTGPNTIAPTKIFDDGKTTYFKLTGTDTPKLELLTAKGAALDIPVRRTSEGLVAVDMVAQNFRLKRAGSEVLIYNEALSGVN